MGHMVVTDPKTYYGGHHSDVEYSSEPTDLRTVGQPHMDPTLEIKEEYVQPPLQTAPFKRGMCSISNSVAQSRIKLINPLTTGAEYI